MILRGLTFALLLLYPISWFAPLLRAGLLPLFGLEEISVITGLVSLWKTDVVLALVVLLFALIAPTVKTVWLMALQWGWARPRYMNILSALSKLAMADVFLIALYITVVKGIGIGTVEVAWGLYLFTGCVIGTFALGHWTIAAAHKQ